MPEHLQPNVEQEDLGLPNEVLAIETSDVGLSQEQAEQEEKRALSQTVERFRGQYGGRLKNLGLSAKRSLLELMTVLSASTAMAVPAHSESAEPGQAARTAATELAQRNQDPEAAMEQALFTIPTDDEADALQREFVKEQQHRRPATAGEMLAASTVQEQEGSQKFDCWEKDELATSGHDVVVWGGGGIHRVQRQRDDQYEEHGLFGVVTTVAQSTEGVRVEAVGDPVDVRGIGHSPSEAVLHGLSNAAQSIEFHAQSSGFMHTADTKTVEAGQTTDRFEHDFSDTSHITYEETLKEYRVTKVREIHDGDQTYYEVEMTVQPGRVGGEANSR